MLSNHDAEFDMLAEDVISQFNDNINDKYNDIDDIMREKLDNYVSCNFIQKNMEIVNELNGVYDNLKKYKETYDIDIDVMHKNEAQFYAILAYIAIEDILREKIEIMMDDDDN
jgi:hypothetical protein